MELFDEKRAKNHQKGKILAGIFFIGFGIVYLLENLGFAIPHWVFTWKMFLIAIGLVMLVKHNFKNFGGYVLIITGGLFMTNEFVPDTFDTKMLWPIAFIMIGVSMIGKSLNLFGHKKKMGRSCRVTDEVEIESDDYLQSTTFFGGVTKNVVSKNFKGANMTTFFGGTEINLTKADLQQPATIDLSCGFGGVTIIVPSNWQVKSELTTIFGGIDDKRPLMDDTSRDSNKVLILKGSCFFGGVEIQSYI